jgi:hypothetical protein
MGLRYSEQAKTLWWSGVGILGFVGLATYAIILVAVHICHLGLIWRSAYAGLVDNHLHHEPLLLM